MTKKELVLMVLASRCIEKFRYMLQNRLSSIMKAADLEKKAVQSGY